MKIGDKYDTVRNVTTLAKVHNIKVKSHLLKNVAWYLEFRKNFNLMKV